MQFIIYLVFISSFLMAAPYPDPTKIELPKLTQSKLPHPVSYVKRVVGFPVLRIEVSWFKDETYKISGLYLENSGTEALLRSSLKKDPLGSYKAELTSSSGTLHSSIGTGKTFRELVRTISFRFPLTNIGQSLSFSFVAEDPKTGVQNKIFQQSIDLSQASQVPTQNVQLKLLRPAKKLPALKFNFYSEGYDHRSEAKFISSAQTAIRAIEANIPGSEHFEFTAVFSPSVDPLGTPEDRGENIIVPNSFLGLYYPYWMKFGRWGDVVYPTSETKYRNALSQVPYDYPLALVDSISYWGVGNYKELTAVPTDNSYFIFLLLHEFGHFMGLNEEYEGGGPTELAFAPGIHEPWSQNMTFNPDPSSLKWLKHTEPGISLPTTDTDFDRYGGWIKNPVGAYRGGYADTLPGKSYKPVMSCTMTSNAEFCPVCQSALKELVLQDLGIKPLTL